MLLSILFKNFFSVFSVLSLHCPAFYSTSMMSISAEVMTNVPQQQEKTRIPSALSSSSVTSFAEPVANHFSSFSFVYVIIVIPFPLLCFCLAVIIIYQFIIPLSIHFVNFTVFFFASTVQSVFTNYCNKKKRTFNGSLPFLIPLLIFLSVLR